MRELPWRWLLDFLAAHLAHVNFTGMSVLQNIHPGRVKEEHEITVTDYLGKFRDKLMQAEDFDLLESKLPFQGFGRAPRHPIVTTKRITVGNDQNSRSHGGIFV